MLKVRELVDDRAGFQLGSVSTLHSLLRITENAIARAASDLLNLPTILDIQVIPKHLNEKN